MSERIRGRVGLGIGRLSDVKNALCKSSAVMDAMVKVVNKNRTQNFRKRSYQWKKNKVGFDGWVILGDAKLIGPLSLVLNLLIRVPTSDLPK